MSTSIEGFMETATDKQKDLLLQLSETAEQEKKCADEVNRIYGSTESGVCSSGGAVIPCEDEDDATVISMRPRQELQRAREQMKEYMEKAVELGMGHLGMIQRNYEHYVGKPVPITS